MNNHPSRRKRHRTSQGHGSTASPARKRKPPQGRPGCEPADAFRPVARTAPDILAIIAHTLGFWPQQSVAILTTTSDSVGPCLRVELPEADEVNDLEFMASWTTHMAGLLEYDPMGTSMFVAVYCGESPGEDSSAPHPQIPQSLATRVVHAITEAGVLSGHDLQDAWCLCGTQWWPVAMPSVVNDTAQIRDSAMYAALVCDGSVVEAEPAADMPQHHQQPGYEPASRNSPPDSTVQKVVQAMQDDPLGDYSWRIGYLECWNRVLSGFEDGAPTALGDSREVTQLLLGCVEPRGLDLVLAMVLTGQPQISRDAWQQWQTEPLAEDNHALLQVAQVMLGQWDGNPDWPTVERCDHVLGRLISMVASMSGGTGINPLPTVEASLWLTRGHLERFRARGSRTQWCLTMAENLAPWHPGIQRLRDLCQMSPVPQWATNRATAWRRSKT